MFHVPKFMIRSHFVVYLIRKIKEIKKRFDIDWLKLNVHWLAFLYILCEWDIIIRSIMKIVEHFITDNFYFREDTKRIMVIIYDCICAGINTFIIVIFISTVRPRPVVIIFIYNIYMYTCKSIKRDRYYLLMNPFIY